MLTTFIEDKLAELQLTENNIQIDISIKIKVKDDNNTVKKMYTYDYSYDHYTIFDLVEDCMIHILLLCNVKDLFNLCLSSKSVYNGYSKYLWNSLFNKKFKDANIILNKEGYTYEIKDTSLIVDDKYKSEDEVKYTCDEMKISRYHPNKLDHSEYKYLTENGYLYDKSIHDEHNFYRDRYFRWLKCENCTLDKLGKIYACSDNNLYMLDYKIYSYFSNYMYYANVDNNKKLDEIINNIIKFVPINHLTYNFIKFIMENIDTHNNKLINIFENYSYCMFYIKYSPTLHTIKSNKPNYDKFPSNTSEFYNIIHSIFISKKISDEFKIDFFKKNITSCVYSNVSAFFYNFDEDITDYIHMNLDMTKYDQHNIEIIISNYDKYRTNKLVLAQLLSYNYSYFYNKLNIKNIDNDMNMNKYPIPLNDIKLKYIGDSFSRNISYKIMEIEENNKKINQDYNNNNSRVNGHNTKLYVNSEYIKIKTLLTKYIDIETLHNFMKEIIINPDKLKINYRILNIILYHKFSDVELKILYGDGIILKSDWNRWNINLLRYIFKRILTPDVSNDIINSCCKRNYNIFKKLV